MQRNRQSHSKKVQTKWKTNSRGEVLAGSDIVMRLIINASEGDGELYFPKTLNDNVQGAYALNY